MSKARPLPQGVDAKPYHLLAHHCLDVAAVGTQALKRLPALRTLFASKLGLHVDHLEPWIGFWLALHDLGKFAEAFQSQCPDVFQGLRNRMPDPAKPYTLRHDSLGMLFWKGVLRDSVIDQAWFGPHQRPMAVCLWMPPAWCWPTAGAS